MSELRWDEASILINIHAVHVVHVVHVVHEVLVVLVVLASDVKSSTLFHVTVHEQVLNANVKLTFCETIS
jgi:hypothetical protein